MIVPAILEKTREEFKARISEVKHIGSVSRVQVDFTNNTYVNSESLNVVDVPSLSPVFMWEAHLMIAEPADFLEYKRAGFGVIIVHYESFKKSTAIPDCLEQIRQLDMKVGLAIESTTDINLLIQYQELVDQFTIVSVAPGFQGGVFIPKALEAIKALRTKLPHAIIEVDGGVKPDNIKAIQTAGADLFVVGSALFKNNAVVENFTTLQQALT